MQEVAKVKNNSSQAQQSVGNNILASSTQSKQEKQKENYDIFSNIVKDESQGVISNTDYSEQIKKMRKSLYSLENKSINGIITPQEQQEMINLDARIKALVNNNENPLLKDRLASSANSIALNTYHAPGVVGETIVQAYEDYKKNKNNAKYQADRKEYLPQYIDQAYNDEVVQLQALKQMSGGVLSEKDEARLQELHEEINKSRQEIVKNKIATPLDISSESFQGLQRAREHSEDAVRGLTGTQRFLWQTGQGIADTVSTLPANAIVPGASLGIMGAKSAANKMLDIGESGGNASDALVRGLASGAIEVATEKIPLDNLMDIVGGKSAKSAIGNILKQSLTEAGEESLSYVANYVADKLAQDENAEFTLQELALSALGGALSGGVMGGGASAVGAVLNGDSTNIDTKNTAVENTAVKQEQNFNNSIVQEDISKHTPQQIKAIEEYKKSVDVNMLDFIEKAENWKVPAKIEMKTGVVSDREAQDIKNITGIDTTGFSRTVKGDRIVHDEIIPIKNKSGMIDKSQMFYDSNGELAPLIAYTKAIDGVYYVIEAVPDSNKKSLQLESARIIKKEVHKVLHAAKKAPTTYVQNDPNTTSFNNSILESNQKYNGNNLIQEDLHAQQASEEIRKEVIKMGQGKTLYNIETFAKNRGLNVQYFNDKDSVRNGYIQDNTIHINMADVKDNQDGVYKAAIHETIHALKENNTSEYQKFYEAVTKYAQGNEYLNSLIGRVTNAYTKEGSEARASITDENGQVVQTALQEEVAAYLAQEIIENPQAFIEKMNREPTFIETVLDFIKKIKNSLSFTNVQNKKLNKAQRTLENYLKKEAGKGVENSRYHISLNAGNEIDKALSDKGYRQEVKLRDYTPKILVDHGVKDLPMLMNATHLRENIFTQQEALEKGLKYNSGINYHGLGKELFMKVIDSLDSPQRVFRGTNKAENTARRESYFLIITTIKDSDGNQINVPIHIGEKGVYNDLRIETNKIATVFGRNDINKYIAKQVRASNLVQVKAKSISNTEGLSPIESATGRDAFDNSIRNEDKKVNKGDGKSQKDTINHKERLSVRLDINNKPYVEIDNDILRGVPKKDWVKTVKHALRSKSLNVNQFEVKVNAISRNEYVGSKYTQNLMRNDKKLYYDKFRMVNNLEEIVQNAYSTKNEAAKHNNFPSFNRGFIDVKLGDKIYSVEVVTGISNDNHEVFYDLVNIIDKQKIKDTSIDDLNNQRSKIREVSFIEAPPAAYGASTAADVWGITSTTDSIRNEGENVNKGDGKSQKDTINDEKLSIKLPNDFSKVDGTQGKSVDEYIKTTVNRVNNPTQENKNEQPRIENYISDATVDDLNNAHTQAYKLQKEADKVINKVNLDADDMQVVTALLKGKISESGIVGENRDDILAVYKAKKAVQDVKQVVIDYNRYIKAERATTADNVLQTVGAWADKKTGLGYSTEIFERNIRDIVPDGKVAKKIIDSYVTPIHTNEAKATRLKNNMRSKIKSLNLGQKKIYNVTFSVNDKPQNVVVSEAGLIQLKGEKLITNETLEKLGADVDNINSAVNVFSEIYEELYNMANNALIENGYAPLGKLDNYFPHFQQKNDKGLTKLLSKMGFEIQDNAIPTSIAGITDSFKPGKNWFGNALKRNSDITVYDALSGFDQYIEGVTGIIFHTGDIQNLRTLENRLRLAFTDEGAKERIVEIEQMDIDEFAKEILKEDAWQTAKKGKLGNFATYLHDYTNMLAGKKSAGDRSIEHDLGRGVYSVSKALESRIASNMVGANIASAFTNFIPIAQSTTEVKPVYIVKAMNETMQSVFSGDSSFINSSDFLTNRFGSDKLTYNTIQNISKKLGAPMEMIDHFTSNVVTRSKYLQNLNSGMDSETAMADANDFAARLIADRSKGAVPLIFDRKNPIAKAITMFQVEQNNQLRYLLKDLPVNLREKGLQVLLFALLKYAVASWCYNQVYEMIVGRRPALDPINIGFETWKDFKTNDNKGEAVFNALVRVAEELPFSAVPLAVMGLSEDAGRLPIGGAVPDFEQLKKLSDPEVSSAKKRDIIKKEAMKSLYYIPPTGGSQIKKTVDAGLMLFKDDGVSYSTANDGSKKVQYAVDNKNPATVAQSLTFGRWSSKEAREYIQNDFKSLNKTQSNVFETVKDSGWENTKAYEFALSVQKAADEKGNNNGYIDNEEVKAYLDKRTDLSKRDKANLFAIMRPNSKSNPYK